MPAPAPETAPRANWKPHVEQVRPAQDPTVERPGRPAPLPLEAYAALGGRAQRGAGRSRRVDRLVVRAQHELGPDARPRPGRGAGRLLLADAGRTLRGPARLPARVERAGDRLRDQKRARAPRRGAQQRLGRASALVRAGAPHRRAGRRGGLRDAPRLRHAGRHDLSLPLSTNANATTFHAGSVIGLLRCERRGADRGGRRRRDPGPLERSGRDARGRGDRRGRGRASGGRAPERIDARIDITDDEWRQWSSGIRYEGSYRPKCCAAPWR